MARNFFNPEGLVWKPLGQLGDLVMLSLLWGICSVPLVTIGPATAALYEAKPGIKLDLADRETLLSSASDRRCRLSSNAASALSILP